MINSATVGRITGGTLAMNEQQTSLTKTQNSSQPRKQAIPQYIQGIVAQNSQRHQNQSQIILSAAMPKESISQSQ